MPMKSVASHIQLISNEPQQKCIHCNMVCTDKFLIFNKRKYGQNTIASQMIENDAQTSYVTSVTIKFAENHLLHVWYVCKLWKKVYIEIWYQHILLTRKKHKRNGKITGNKLLPMQKLPCWTATNNHMCVL